MHSGALCKAAPAVAKLFMQMGPAAARAAILITWGGGMANKILSPLKKSACRSLQFRLGGKKKKKKPNQESGLAHGGSSAGAGTAPRCCRGGEGRGRMVLSQPLPHAATEGAGVQHGGCSGARRASVSLPVPVEPGAGTCPACLARGVQPEGSGGVSEG